MHNAVTHHLLSDDEPDLEQLPQARFSPGLQTEHDTIYYGFPLASWGQLFWLCPLTASCASPTSSLVVWGEKLKGPLLRISIAQKQHHYCHPKSETQIITGIPVETRTVFYSKGSI